jgi:3D (Asp-Asp-Asp) domain-containing protein
MINLKTNRLLRIFFAIFAAAFVMHGAICVKAQSPLPNDALQRVKTFFTDKLSARYMEKNCVETTYRNWENLPLKECTYSVKGHGEPTPKKAKVIMLNAAPEQLARWVVSTCLEVAGNANQRCTDWLSKRVLNQSGAQFPIAGIVYEDLNGDGINEVYVFRDGVTVRVNGLTNGSTQQPTNGQINNSLNGEVVSTGKFARIQGTTRVEYKKNASITKEKNPDIFNDVYGGAVVDVGNDTDRKIIWLDVVRNLYKAAWGKDRNELMISWARENVDEIAQESTETSAPSSVTGNMTFDFPEPSNLTQKKILWATHYYVYGDVRSVAGGHPLLNMAGNRLGALLSGRDWCLGAIEGTIRVIEENGQAKVYNFAGTGTSVQVDCAPFVSNPSINLNAIGKSRYSISKGSFGDGVEGMILVPYRSIAVDRTFIPYGTVIYIPAARGRNIILPSGQTVKHDGYFYAADTGGAIKINHIDVFGGINNKNPFPNFVKSKETGTFEAFVITNSQIVEKLKKMHQP